MKENSQTVLWNDSADPKELKDALTWGIVGATTSTLKINNRGSALAQWQRQMERELCYFLKVTFLVVSKLFPDSPSNE